MEERKEKFTPGPWRVMGPYGSLTRPGIDADLNGAKRSIILCGTEEDKCGIVGIENAALIAAAPDMYAALKGLLDSMKRTAAGFPLQYEEQIAREEYAQNALAKALGDA